MSCQWFKCACQMVQKWCSDWRKSLPIEDDGFEFLNQFSLKKINVSSIIRIWHDVSSEYLKRRKQMKVVSIISFTIEKKRNLSHFCLGEYTCQIDDDRGVKTSGYLYVEGIDYYKFIIVIAIFMPWFPNRTSMAFWNEITCYIRRWRKW